MEQFGIRCTLLEMDEYTELLRTLDTHFSALKADKHSEYYRLYDKWMGFYQAQPGFPRWLFWFFVFLLGASGLLGVFSLLLRQQVRKRTEELRNTNQELNRHKHGLQPAHDDL